MKVNRSLRRFVCGPRIPANSDTDNTALKAMKKVFLTILVILLLLAILPKFF